MPDSGAEIGAGRLARPRRGAVRRIVGMLCLTYVLSHYLRASHGVIAPDLIREFALSPEQLALLTAAFFITFAAAQIPVGMLLDRFGPRRTLYSLLVFAVAGTLLFPMADSVAGLALARALMGLGCAAMAMAAVVTFARWVRPDRFAAVSGLLFAAGGAGGLLATTPLALAAQSWGWRATFYLLAAAAVLIGLIGWATVRDAPPGHPALRRAPESPMQVLRGVWTVLRTPVLWRISAATLVNYPAAITILALWGAPFLYDRHGLDAVARGNVLLAMSVAMIVGYLAYGQLDRLLDTRKWLVVFGLAATAAPCLLLAVRPDLPVWAVTLLFALLGGASAFGSLLVAHVRAIFPDHLFGRAATINNMALVTGSALLQAATGAVAGLFPAEQGHLPPEAYRAVFACIAVALLAALAVYLPVADARPSADRAARGD